MKSATWMNLTALRIAVLTSSLAISLATALLPGAAAYAQTAPWDAPAFTAEPAAMVSFASHLNAERYAPVTLFLEESRFSFDSANRCKFARHVIYRVETQDAVQHWSSVSAQWSPWRQKRPVIRARVILPDGTVHTLDPNVLSEAPAHDQRPDIYEDKRVYSGPLPAVAAGSIVEWEIVSEDTAPLFEGGVLWRAYFGASVPMLHGVLVIETPKNTPLRYVTHLLPNVKVNKTESGNSFTVTFEQGPMPAIEKREPYTPGDVPRWPAVEFSTGTSWQAVAGAYQREIESAIKPQDVSELMKGSAGLTGQALILRLVNNLHRNVRYTGLEFGASGLIPHPAGETVARGYGDCKDKAVVLVSLLRAAGIPANLALLATRERDEISPELAGIGSFDHAIVYVPGEPGTWIDATAEFSQPGVLPWAAQGRLALVIGPTTETLVRTPVAKSSDNLLVEKREFHLSEYGPARIVETSKPKGDIESRYRALFGGHESKKTNEEIDNYVKSTYLAESLTHFEHTPGDDLEHPFEMSIEMASGKRGFSTLEDAVVAIPFSSIIARYPQFVYAEDDSEKPNNAKEHVRKQDVEMPPFITEWQYKIIPPPGFGPPAMPQDRELNLGPAVLTQKYRAESDESVSVVFRFDSVKARYSLEELKALRQAFNATRSETVMIRFPQTGAAQLAAGNVREALASYRALIKQHPAESIHHLQFANALLAAGFGDQARAEANKAVTLDSASATAYAVLGWILEHDDIGRRFGRGFDLQGAITAYRKSLQLDPKQWTTHADLAILLEHGADGERYSAEAPLKEAADEYRALKQLDKAYGEKYADNLLYALFYSRQWKEVGEVYAGLPSTSTRQAIAIAATAAREGSGAALAESASLGLSESARSNVLVEAANLLVRLRMYPRALDLLKAAASSQEDSAQVRRRIEVLSAVRPYEEVLFPESDPRRVVQKMFVWTWAPHSKPDDLFQLVEIDEADRKDEVQAAARLARRLRSSMEKQGVPGNVTADIIVSNLKMTTEGNDASGYRIRVFGMSEKPQVALVARRPAGYRIVAYEDVRMVGPEVLRRIAANDLKGAKQWLDWAREEQSLRGGDDPLAGPVFPRFWTRGDDPDPGQMKLAAIALMVNSSAIREHVEDLKAARAKAPEGDQTKLDLALMAASFKLENWALLRESAGRLLAAYPNSDTAFAFMTIACHGEKDWTGWEKTVAARQARLPDDLTAVRSAASLADASGDFVKARSILRGLIDSGRAELGDVNNYSWYALFTGKVSDEDVRVLEHSIAARSTDPGFDSLHTLACLYAQVGKGKEARELLLKAMDSAGYDEPDSAIWLGFGSIAEQYGLADTALADYRRVQKPEGFMSPSSNYQLAQRNMQHLAVSNSQTTIAAKRRLP